MFCAKAGLADDSDDDDDLLPITYPAIVQYDVDMEELSDGAVHDDLDEYFPLRDQPWDFNLDGPATTIDESQEPVHFIEAESEEDTNSDHTVPDFLRLHRRLGHLSMDKMQAMAKQGLRYLISLLLAGNLACLYGKATKRAWRVKRQQRIVLHGQGCVCQFIN